MPEKATRDGTSPQNNRGTYKSFPASPKSIMSTSITSKAMGFDLITTSGKRISILNDNDDNSSSGAYSTSPSPGTSPGPASTTSINPSPTLEPKVTTTERARHHHDLPSISSLPVQPQPHIYQHHQHQHYHHPQQPNSMSSISSIRPNPSMTHYSTTHPTPSINHHHNNNNNNNSSLYLPPINRLGLRTSPTPPISPPTSASPAPVQTSAGVTKAQKKYTCHCNRSFTTSGHLARHMRIHTGEKNYVCPQEGCGARFSRQDNCMQHYRTHLGGRNAGSGNKRRRKSPSRDGNGPSAGGPTTGPSASPSPSGSNSAGVSGSESNRGSNVSSSQSARTASSTPPESPKHHEDNNPLKVFARVAVLQAVN